MNKTPRVLYTLFILLIVLGTACTNEGNVTEQSEASLKETVWIHEIPVVAGAYDIQHEGMKVQYKAMSPLVSLMSFYDNNLVDAGWERDSTRVVNGGTSETSEPLKLLYTHSDGRTLLITVVAGDEEDDFSLNVTMEQGEN